MSMQTKVGFIGLGNMGYGLVANLLKNKYSVLVFDIDDEKVDPVVKRGAEKAGTIKSLSENVQTVILCLPHPKISKTVIFNTGNLLSAKSLVKTIIDTSTLTPEDSQEFYHKLKSKNIEFLCAPMLGGKKAAAEALLHFLVEGDKEAFDRHKVLFSVMGKRVDYMGQVPAATLAKLAYNICRYSNLATAVEVTRLLHAYSTNTEPIYQLLVQGSLDNFGQVWKEDMQKMALQKTPYKPSNIPQKDLTLVMKLATKNRLSNKLFKVIRDVYASLL